MAGQLLPVNTGLQHQFEQLVTRRNPNGLRRLLTDNLDRDWAAFFAQRWQNDWAMWVIKLTPALAHLHEV